MRFDQTSLGDLLASIAAKTPTPGGGAVASITAALAAALAHMVVNYSIGKKSLSEHEARNRNALASLQKLGTRALELAEADAQAYAALNQLMRLDAGDARRQREIKSAVDAAIAAPSTVLDAAAEILAVLQGMLGTTNAMLKSDLAIAGVLAEAAARSAAWNVRINLPLIENTENRRTQADDLDLRLCAIHDSMQTIEKACEIPLI